MHITDIMNTFISGMGGNSETALSYILLGTFAAAMNHTGLTDIVSTKIIDFVNNKKRILYTGCIIDSKGTILTSSHVIANSDDITVTISNGETYKAEVVRLSGMNSDLALLKINTHKPLKTIIIGNSKNIKVGQKVLAIGNPFGFSGTLTQGIVSRIDYKRNKIQTDAAINPGSSGGPLLNTSGEVIGINQAIYNPDNNTSNIGIGFAIPINSVRQIIAELK